MRVSDGGYFPLLDVIATGKRDFLLSVGLFVQRL